MITSKFIDLFEKKYPTNIAENWDNVGLLVGDKEKEIKKVLITLDVSSKAIDKAIDINADMIISHHPMIFRPLKKIVYDDITARKVIRLLEEKISVYAAHTNLDSAIDGLNEYVWEKIGLNSYPIYSDESFNKPIRYYKLKDVMSIENIASIIKQNLNIENVRIVKDEYYTSNIIKKVAIITGSGMDFINEVKEKVDLFITADIKHHDALDSLEYGLPLIDIGHYESEVFSVDLIKEFLEQNTDIEIETYYSNPILKII